MMIKYRLTSIAIAATKADLNQPVDRDDEIFYEVPYENSIGKNHTFHTLIFDDVNRRAWRAGSNTGHPLPLGFSTSEYNISDDELSAMADKMNRGTYLIFNPAAFTLKKEPIEVPERALSFGEKAAGIGFNPGGDERVNRIKQMYANIIDECNNLRNETENQDMKRYYSTAITFAEISQMEAVKAFTWRH